jgi:NTP pyrophosphatase (non-canonical NTP hydrolase)
MLKKLQKEREVWALEQWGEQSLDTLLAGITEEVGELAGAYVRRHNNKWSSDVSRARMLDAVGDIVIYLAGYCSRLSRDDGVDVDFERVVSQTWRKVRTVGDCTCGIGNDPDAWSMHAHDCARYHYRPRQQMDLSCVPELD